MGRFYAGADRRGAQPPGDANERVCAQSLRAPAGYRCWGAFRGPTINAMRSLITLPVPKPSVRFGRRDLRGACGRSKPEIKIGRHLDCRCCRRLLCTRRHREFPRAHQLRRIGPQETARVFRIAAVEPVIPFTLRHHHQLVFPRLRVPETGFVQVDDHAHDGVEHFRVRRTEVDAHEFSPKAK